MTFSRRDFLNRSTGVSCGLLLPGLWGRAALAAPSANQPGGKPTVLVVVQLNGGNDGLNTVIPVNDPEYRKSRPQLAIPARTALPFTHGLAWHPACRPLANLVEAGQLAAVLGVGYPQPNRSHFVSMDIWHRGSFSEDDPTGWLGKTVDAWSRAGRTDAGSLHVGASEAPLALESPSGKTFTLQSLDDYCLKTADGRDDPTKRLAIEGFAKRQSESDSPLLARIRQSAREAYDSSERIARIGRESNAVTYPATELAQRLRLVARLIESDIPERVYYTMQDGYDTHATQLPSHANLLTELSEALAAFQKDLQATGHGERVVTLVFSEFGRRVAENASAGTDHGAASTLFLMGAPVSAGAIGSYPSLTDLDDGDLKHTLDFRRVYATLLDRWLGIDSTRVLPGSERFDPLPLLRG
jgi:uncharacterized protein (DUF1501 family)